MKRDNAEGILVEQIPLLIKYVKGNISEEENVIVREALEVNPRLKNDLHFIVKAHYGIYDKEICPSSLLLSHYYHKTGILTEEITKALSKHVNNCEKCEQKINDMEDFHLSVENSVKTTLDQLPVDHPHEVIDILKEMAKHYLAPEIADNIFKGIKDLSIPPEKIEPQLGLGLSGRSLKELTEKEREYLNVLKAVIEKQEKLNLLLEEGDKDKIRKAFLDILDDEEKVTEIMEIYNE